MSSLEPKRYDAFLSYNSQDRPAVHEMAERLKGEGLVLYLEEWELAPGREFQPMLAEGLRDSKTCVVFLGPNGLGPWQKQELQVASTGGPATRRSPSSRCCCPAPSGPGGGPGGGDWLTVRTDGFGILDVRATLESDDGALIYMAYSRLGDLGEDG